MCPPEFTDIAEEEANLCSNFRGRLWCQSKILLFVSFIICQVCGQPIWFETFRSIFNLYFVQVNVCIRSAFYSSHVHTSCGHMWTKNYVHPTHLQVNSDHGFVQEPPVKTVMDAWRRRSWMLYCQALPAKSCTWEVRCKAWKRFFCLEQGR